MISPAAVLASLRRRSPFVDHLVRTVGRYQADAGDRLAAAVTFYWFLSLFPILLLALAGYGYLNAGESVAQLNARLAKDLGDFLPPELITTLTKTLATAKGKAGVIGLAGLLIAGLGWIDALREALCTVWHEKVPARNIVMRKVTDVVVLVGLFATIAASTSATALVGSGPKFLLDQAGFGRTAVAQLFLQALGLVLGIAVDVVLFLYLFLRLASVAAPVRQVLKGAVFGAVALTALTLVGGFYFQHTTTSGKATYGVFAVVVGLLLFLNLIARLVLLAAAFAVTAGVGDLPPVSVPPSAAPEQHAGPPLRGSDQARLAARAMTVAGGVVLVAVAAYALRTVQALLRR